MACTPLVYFIWGCNGTVKEKTGKLRCTPADIVEHMKAVPNASKDNTKSYTTSTSHHTAGCSLPLMRCDVVSALVCSVQQPNNRFVCAIHLIEWVHLAAAHGS